MMRKRPHKYQDTWDFTFIFNRLVFLFVRIAFRYNKKGKLEVLDAIKV